MLKIKGISSDHCWDMENGFFWFSEPKRLCKILAQFEIYKQITHLSGDVMEFGVYKGASILRLATFRLALEAPHARRIIGFDAFGAFPRAALDRKDDEHFIDGFEGAGGEGLSREELIKVLDFKGLNENIDLVAGDVRETLAGYLEKHDRTRIAFLHLDMDVYEPTLQALEQCWDRVMPGGIVMIDDYNAVAGATQAVDDFFRGRVEIKKSPYSHVPAYLVKPFA